MKGNKSRVLIYLNLVLIMFYEKGEVDGGWETRV